ncbi:MAG: FimV/HubP family polar landmark protein, partial [Natronospirillum sp.]
SETIEDVEEEIAQPFESSTAPLNPASAAEAIENAELYMAFQRYDEAESALSTALRQVPGEPSLQLKLLELYAETGQHSDFDSLAAEFSGDPEAIAGLRQQLDSAGSGDIEDDLDENGNLNDLDLSFDEDDDDFAFSLEADVERPSRTNLMNLDHELSDLELPDLDVPDLDIPELDVPELDQAMANELRSDASTEFASDNLEFDRTAVPEPPERDVSASIEDDRMMDFDLSGVELEEPASQSLEAKSPPDDQLAKLDTDFDLGEFEEGAPEDSLHELAMAEDTSLDNEAELDESADEFNLDELSEDLDFSELDDIAEVAGLDEAVAEPAESSAPSAEPVAPEANLEEEVQAPDAFDSAMDFPPLTAGDGEDWDDDFDFLEGSDEVATKLDLARAYVDMEDAEGARDILNEVVEEGDEQQKADAKVLLESLG